MTEVFSSIFGRKKPKGPAPAPPPVASPSSQDDFVIVPSASANNVRPTSNFYGNNSESGDYESLFSFLKVQSPDMNNGANRPGRPAPPVPAPRATGSPFLYGINPTPVENRPAEGNISSNESQTSSFYVSGVPFQISKSLGGGVSVQQMTLELSDILSRVKPPNLAEYEYSFNLEEQVIREVQQR